MDPETWKTIAAAAAAGFSAMATALAWVVRAWRADTEKLNAALVQSEREKATIVKEHAQTKLGLLERVLNASHAQANATEHQAEATRELAGGLQRNTDALIRRDERRKAGDSGDQHDTREARRLPPAGGYGGNPGAYSSTGGGRREGGR